MYIYILHFCIFPYSGSIYTSVAGWKEWRGTLMWPHHATEVYGSYTSIYNCGSHSPTQAAPRFSLFERKTNVNKKGKNNDNNYNGVPGPAGGVVEKQRFQQTRSTHSGAVEKETLNIKLWEIHIILYIYIYIYMYYIKYIYIYICYTIVYIYIYENICID